MYATLFGIGAAFLAIFGLVIYKMPIYVCAAVIVSGIANGMVVDGLLDRRRGKPSETPADSNAEQPASP